MARARSWRGEERGGRKWFSKLFRVPADGFVNRRHRRAVERFLRDGYSRESLRSDLARARWAFEAHERRRAEFLRRCEEAAWEDRVRARYA